MIQAIIKKLFSNEKRRFMKEAKVVFKEEFDDVPVDDPLLKKILLYVKGEFVEELEYSDTIIDELRREGVPVLDETIDPKAYKPTISIEIGRVQL